MTRKQTIDTDAIREQLFKVYVDGNGEGFEEIFDFERSSLYDFLIRMSAQIETAADQIEEVFYAVESEKSSFPSYQAIRLALFRTLRQSAGGSWASQVSGSAIPAATSVSHEHMRISSVKDHVNKQEMIKVEQILMLIPPPQREALLLNLREGFSFSEISQITSMEQNKVMASFYEGMKFLKTMCTELSNSPVDLMKTLPRYEAPPKASLQTQALSELIEDLREARRGPANERSRVLPVALLLGVSVALVYYLYPSLFLHAWTTGVSYFASACRHVSTFFHSFF